MSGSSMLVIVFVCGMRLKVWKMKLILWLCRFDRLFLLMLCMLMLLSR